MTSPQGKFVEPIAPRRKYEFIPGKGMVPVEDDTSEAMEYDIAEAMADQEEESRRKKSFANVGYAALKRRG